MPEAVWVHDEARQIRRNRRADRLRRRPWRMHYDLAYDGGGSTFDQFYRTQFGARWSAFFHLHLRSYGGNAALYQNT